MALLRPAARSGSPLAVDLILHPVAVLLLLLARFRLGRRVASSLRGTLAQQMGFCETLARGAAGCVWRHAVCMARPLELPWRQERAVDVVAG